MSQQRIEGNDFGHCVSGVRQKVIVVFCYISSLSITAQVLQKSQKKRTYSHEKLNDKKLSYRRETARQLCMST